MPTFSPAVAWTLLAIVLAVLEVPAPAFVFAPLAVAAAGAALAAFLGAGIEGQLLVFAATAAVVLVLAHRGGRRWLGRGPSLPMNADALPGARALVASAIDNSRDEGRVMLDGMEWTARSARGTSIPVDTRVRVVRVEGVKLIVEPESGPESEED